MKTTEIDPLRDTIKRLNEEIKQAEQNKEQLMKYFSKGKKKIKHLKNQIKNAEGIVKEKFEKEFAKQKLAYKERLKEIRQIEKELDRKNKKLDKRYSELQDKYLKELKSEFAPREITTINGYPAILNPHGYKFVHEYRYESVFGKVPHSLEIHHIDKNKMNSNLWNLIAIPKHQHEKLLHGKIIYGNWDQGLKELMNTLGWTKKDLPKHIIEHMEQ
ncbi:MAG: HNH endonuclease [Candidatus Woesearchaeota archaeon]